MVALLFIGLTGCVTYQSNNTPSVQKTLSSSPNATMIFSVAPSAYNTKLPTPAKTQPVVTVLPSATSPVTYTPQATLSVAEQVGYLTELMTKKGECESTCWWGIQPRVTKWQSVEDLLIPLGWQGTTLPAPNAFATHEFPLLDAYNAPYITLTFVEQEGVVQSISVLTGVNTNNIANYPVLSTMFQQYSLYQMLVQNGKPTQIFVGLQSARTEPNAPFGYALWLLYDQLGTAVYYDGLATQGETIQVCPTVGNLRTVDLFFRSPISSGSIIKMVDPNFEALLSQGYLRPLEEATALNIDLFYTKFSTPNNQECFKSPANIWP